MMKRLRWVGILLTTLALLALPLEAFARRSGGSFSSRSGFRSAPRANQAPGASYDRGYRGGGSNFFFFPGFGWGMGASGAGGFGFGNFMMLGMLGLAGFYMYRTLKNASRQSGGYGYGHGSHGGVDVRPDRAYLYKLQLGLGRSARSLQQKLEQFAEQGDTSSEAGLSSLLAQTTLELARQKHSVRYVQLSSDGPLSMSQGETKMNSLALVERSRFEVERVRGADGRVIKAKDRPAQSEDVLEYIVVTLIVATRQALGGWKTISEHQELDGVLAALGGISPSEILGLEVVWTPADPEDALTENDLLTTYPDLRGI